MNKVLIVGIDSFTGKYLSNYLKKQGFDVYGTSFVDKSNAQYLCNITDKKQIENILTSIKPNYIIHLSGISYAGHKQYLDFYKINTIGTTNLLQAILDTNTTIKKIIIASSATVYGNQGVEVLDESLCPMPVEHYGVSKYAAECLAKNFMQKIPVIIARPFNYTGIGQSDIFLIPKIVKHFKDRKRFIELGNLNVAREFNSVNYVCEVYKRLLKCNASGEIVNIASGRGIKLLDIMEIMNGIAKYNIEIRINRKFIRKNEIFSLTGSTKKLFSLIGKVEQEPIKNTLKEMYES